MNGRLLVTGGSGFIGSHIVRQAVNNGWRVAVLDNAFTEAPEGVTVYRCDIRDEREVFRAFEDFTPNAVSHHAAQVSVPASFGDPARDASINVMGSIHVLNACARVRVDRFVFASSGGAIYGDVPGSGGASELYTMPKPASPYGVSKLAFESTLEILSKQIGMRAVSLRYSNVYGPGQKLGVVAKFLVAALKGDAITIFGANHVRDYVYVQDVVRANMRALAGMVKAPVMNVSTGEGTSTADLAKWVLLATDSHSPIIHEEAGPGDVARSVLSPSRFREFVGHSTPLCEGITETLDRLMCEKGAG